MAIIKSVQGQFYSDNVMRTVQLTNSIVFVKFRQWFHFVSKNLRETEGTPTFCTSKFSENLGGEK